MTRTVLQRVDLDPPSEVAGLYYLELETKSRPAAASEAGLVIPEGNLVSFDTYFNALFENAWFEYSSLSSIDFRIEVQGDCVISVWRQSPERDRYLLKRQHLSTGGSMDFCIEHDDELRVEAGRVWFDVEALSDVTVLSADWSTTNEPQRPVSMAVVFCTFNREKYLQRILLALDSDERTIDAMAKVFVINQGDAFTAEEIVGPTSTGRILPKIHLIEQPNIGGCGGFTRGMYETVADENLTHFLLMDDDSRVNPESVARAAHYLAFCDENVVVGGHMLNLHRPKRLFEAGAMLDSSSLQPTPIHHNAGLAEPDGLAPLLRSGAVSYNGWWMFGARASVVDEVGYPMPCFIRGDDMEFGLRLRDAKIRTIPVPGIAVWHEPFYLKLGGWQFFFEVRNRLAMASLHNHSNFGGIRKDLRRVFARDIAMCRYHACKMMIEAIRDYQSGPDVALDTTNAPLLRAVEIVKQYGPEKIDEAAYAGSKFEDTSRRGELRRMLDAAQVSVERRLSKVAIAGHIVRRLVVAERPGDTGPVIRAIDLRPHKVANYDSYVVIEEHGGLAWQFRRNQTTEKELWREFTSLLKAIEFDPRYLAAFDESKRFEATWREIFGSIEAQPLATTD